MRFLASLYLNQRLYVAFLINIALFVFAYSFPILLGVAEITFLVIIVLVFIDIFLLYSSKEKLVGFRKCSDKLSNGDINNIYIHLENRYDFTISVKIIDELPVQFQYRDFSIQATLVKGEKKIIRYELQPKKRGEYHFGTLNLYASSSIGLVARRLRYSQDMMVPVYPAFLQLKQYELLAISNRLVDIGIKKIRKLGHNMEFEQIKEYVPGDDIRTINWKATARNNGLMVNHYQDEKSQQVYSVIDKGRNMKMPFDKLSLLDYAINASLVISRIALLKDDKVGLLTFNKKVSSFLPASKVNRQMHRIIETLYNQKTAYRESDMEKLYIATRRRMSQRSLILFYTNFESLSSMRRQLPYFRRIATNHLLVVIFFRNTELQQLIDKKAANVEDIYLKTIAEKFDYEKKQIVKELKQYGIQAILTAPEDLTVNSINKYLEIKSRGLV
ncbi:MAG: DUF58 domain-containing protein [Thermonemataceae bacterium]